MRVNIKLECSKNNQLLGWIDDTIKKSCSLDDFCIGIRWERWNEKEDEKRGMKREGNGRASVFIEKFSVKNSKTLKALRHPIKFITQSHLLTSHTVSRKNGIPRVWAFRTNR